MNHGTLGLPGPRVTFPESVPPTKTGQLVWPSNITNVDTTYANDPALVLLQDQPLVLPGTTEFSSASTGYLSEVFGNTWSSWKRITAPWQIREPMTIETLAGGVNITAGLMTYAPVEFAAGDTAAPRRSLFVTWLHNNGNQGVASHVPAHQVYGGECLWVRYGYNGSGAPGQQKIGNIAVTMGNGRKGGSVVNERVWVYPAGINISSSASPGVPGAWVPVGLTDSTWWPLGQQAPARFRIVGIYMPPHSPNAGSAVLEIGTGSQAQQRVIIGSSYPDSSLHMIRIPPVYAPIGDISMRLTHLNASQAFAAVVSFYGILAEPG